MQMGFRLTRKVPIASTKKTGVTEGRAQVWFGDQRMGVALAQQGGDSCCDIARLHRCPSRYFWGEWLLGFSAKTGRIDQARSRDPGSSAGQCASGKRDQ